MSFGMVARPLEVLSSFKLRPPSLSFFYFYFFIFYFYFILLYTSVLVLPYIDMNPPQVYMSSQS